MTDKKFLDLFPTPEHIANTLHQRAAQLVIARENLETYGEKTKSAKTIRSIIKATPAGEWYTWLNPAPVVTEEEAAESQELASGTVAMDRTLKVIAHDVRERKQRGLPRSRTVFVTRRPL